MPALKEFVDNINGYRIMALITETQKGAVSLLAAVHEQISPELLLKNLGAEAKILNLTFGNYKLIRLDLSDRSEESLETDLLEALKSLPESR